MALGVTLAIASLVIGVASQQRIERKTTKAQDEQRRVETGVQNEQATRERRKQVRQHLIDTARVENIAATQGRGGGADANSDVSDAFAASQASLGRNLNTISSSIVNQNAISQARSNVMNAGNPSLFATINQSLQPYIFGNVKELNSFGENTNIFK